VVTPAPGLDRRRFIALLVAGAAGSTVVAACGDDDDGGGDAGPPGSPVPPLPTSLAEALATLAATVRRVAPELEPLELSVDPADPEALAAAVAELDEATRRDLAAGDTVDVAGWVLSTTEARLCLAAA
jgi:hypothetical protein